MDDTKTTADRTGPDGDDAALVARVGGAFSVIASRPVDTGECVLRLEGVVKGGPSRYTVQIGAAEHLDLPDGVSLDEQLDRYAWRFLNHSCDPNAMIAGRELIALRPIRAGDEVTFDYATTEYSMAEPFVCECGARCCVGEVRGYRALSDARRRAIARHAAAHVRDLWDRERASAAG